MKINGRSVFSCVRHCLFCQVFGREVHSGTKNHKHYCGNRHDEAQVHSRSVDHQNLFNLHSKAQTKHNSQEYAIGDRHKESDEYLQENHDSQVSNRDPDGSEHFVHFSLVFALAKSVEEDKENCEGAHDGGDEDDVKRKVFLK
jgi:hypothetical protein